MSIKKFDEKVAVITGSGSGIGQALACELGARGVMPAQVHKIFLLAPKK